MADRAARIPVRIGRLLSKSLPRMSPSQESAWVKMLAVALPVLCLDAWTKAAIAGSYELGAMDDIGPVTIHHLQNPGINYMLSTLGIFPGVIPAFLIVSACAVGCFFAIRHAPRTRYGWIPMGLMLGGALGNGLDLAAHGYVTDFIYINLLSSSANVADVAIVAGLICIYELRDKDQSSVETTTRGGPPSSKSLTQ